MMGVVIWLSLFKFKSLGRVGPRANSSGRYLKRTIEWRGDRFVYHANDKHVDDIIELMGVDFDLFARVGRRGGGF